MDPGKHEQCVLCRAVSAVCPVVSYLVSGERNFLAGLLGALHLDVQDATGRPVTAVEVITEVQVPDACDVPFWAESPLRLVLGELLDGDADGLLELVVPFPLAGAPCDSR